MKSLLQRSVFAKDYFCFYPQYAGMSRQSYGGSIGLLLACGLYGGPPSQLEKRLEYLEKLLSLDLLKFEHTLWNIRRPPAPSQERAALIRSLPEEGHVRVIGPDQTAKLRALHPIFDALGRKFAYHVQVIDVPQAFLGLHERTVILLSVNALDLLGTEELCAVVTHEAGHEFFWDEYALARATRSESAMRRIELLADAAAVLTLDRLEIDAGFLITALRKLTEFNQTHLGFSFNANSYPTLESRAEKILDLSRRLTRRAPPHHASKRK